MPLDIRTVILFSVLAGAAIALALVATLGAQFGPNRRALRLWAHGTFATAAAALLLPLRGTVSDLIAIVLANALLAFGFADYVRAQRELSGRPERGVVPYSVAGAVAAIALASSLAAPASRLGGALVALALAVLPALLAHAAWKVEPAGERVRSAWLMVAIAAAGTAIFASFGFAEAFLDAAPASAGLPVLVLAYAAIAPLAASFAIVLACNERINAELDRTAVTDPLTGLMNRRAIQDLARGLLADAKRHGRAFGLLVIDIDHFKKINDALGHAGGDEVLRALTFAFGKELRGGDYLGRYGGEEFVIVLPGTSLGGARELAERLRRTVERQPFLIRDTDVAVNVSIGCAEAGQTDDLEAALQRADRALEEAKRLGRNRVATASVSSV